MSRPLLSVVANCDIAQAYRWYRGISTELALRFEAAVEAALDKIGESPLAFPQYDRRHRFTKLMKFKYLVVYRLLGGFALVVAVAHTSRSKRFWNRQLN